MFRLVVSGCALLILTACDSAPRYVGVGDVIEVDRAAQRVLIRHDAIAGLMDADTTRFGVSADEVRAGLTPGARVRFELRRTGGQLVVTRATPLALGNPGIHDHTPHHGGIVAMAGMLHLEAIASPDGRLQLYLTDVWRRPVPLTDVSGAVTLDLPDGRRSLSLNAVGDALTAQGPALNSPTVNARFALRRSGQDVEVSFLLPLRADDSGAAGVPVNGCVPAAHPAPGGPRCTLAFARPVVAVALAPDAATLLVAQVDLGISAWRLPAVAFALGFAPPPAVAVPVAEPPHPEAPNAVLVRPDGQEAVVAMENRLVRYAMASGRVVGTFDGPGGIVRAAAWSPDGSALLVSMFYDRAAYVLDAIDGRVRQRLPVEREAAAVAFAPDGRAVAVASEVGPVTLFEVDAATPSHELRGARGPVRALAFVGERLIAAGDDGMLRIWNRSDGTLSLERQIGRTIRTMAVNGPRGLAAVVGGEPTIQLVALADGAAAGMLVGHQAQVLSLAWSDATLVSGDSAGYVMLWDVSIP